MRSALALTILFALAATASAAEIGPKRPSDIVFAYIEDGNACPGFPASTDAFLSRIFSNATIAPLVIPNKRVLVVRRIELATSGGTPGASGLITIQAGVGDEYVGYVTRPIVLDASGTGRLDVDLPLGFVVPAGGAVCITNTLGEDFGGRLEGYFAPAK